MPQRHTLRFGLVALGLAAACAAPPRHSVPVDEEVVERVDVGNVEREALAVPTPPTRAVAPSEAPAGREDASPLPFVLDRIEAIDGVAMSRVRLTTGQIVQVNHGCNEWAGYTEGMLIEADGSRVVRFVGGPFFEIPGFLIVEEQLQIGADGGEPWTNDTPARGVIEGLNGAVWVTRVVAIDLERGVVHDEAGWDSFRPIAELDERGTPTGTVFFASEGESVAYDDPAVRIGKTVRRWNVARHRIRSIATLKGPFAVQANPGRTLFSLGAGELVEVRRDGKPRRLSSAIGSTLAPSGLGFPSGNVGEPPPREWATPEGRPIVVERAGRREVPMVGACGVDTVLEIGDALLLDDGLYRRPPELDWPIVR
ncbi:MAG: hypothetical protein AAF799_25525 [Myxococcota bacterium]